MEISKGFKKYDPKSEAEWFEFNEMKFLIAPMLNPAQKKVMTQLFTLKEAIGLEEFGALAFEDVKANVAIGRTYEMYSKGLVFGWENVEENGEPLKFSHEKIHEWMMEHSDFAVWVTTKAKELQKKLAEEKEEIVKN